MSAISSPLPTRVWGRRGMTFQTKISSSVEERTTAAGFMLERHEAQSLGSRQGGEGL